MEKAYLEQVTFKYKEEWHTYIEPYGFSVSIKNHNKGVDAFWPSGTWCTYLHFFDKPSALPGKHFEKTPMMDFLWGKISSSSLTLFCLQKNVLEDLSWNGDITFIEKTITEEGQRRIKIGDDFVHAWDMHQHYTLEYMQQHILDIAAECHELLKKEGLSL